MKIDFSGTISSQLEPDIRPVYFGEAPILKLATYVLFVAVTIYVVCFSLNIELFDTIRLTRYDRFLLRPWRLASRWCCCQYLLSILHFSGYRIGGRGGGNEQRTWIFQALSVMKVF